jgi:hypothetical protein
MVFDQVDYSSSRYLWQQTTDAIGGFFLSLPRRAAVHDPWANRTGLPELDEQAVKVQPLPISGFSSDPYDVGTGTLEGERAGDVN